MRILRNQALTSTISLNCIAINNDKTYIALGDINKIINVFHYQSIEDSIKSNTTFNNNYNLILKQHDDTVNCLVFENYNTNYLISGSSDKNIIIWKINENFTFEIIRILKAASEVLDICLTNNDEFFLSCCVDNSIYLWKNGINNSQFSIKNISIHTNFVSSIIIDPISSSNSIRFASISDKSRLILSELLIDDPNLNHNFIYDYNEFSNPKTKNSSFYKKIDWSADGNWIVSVNHQFIKNYRISHARLINKSDLSKPMILIGFESDILIAKFSKVIYTDKNGRKFSILATSDRKGGLILWRVFQSNFKLITNITNFSESIITNMNWSPDGEFLFTTNNNGSLIILQINEYNRLKFENVQIQKNIDSSFNPHISASNFQSVINNNLKLNNFKKNYSNEIFKYPNEKLETHKRIQPTIIHNKDVRELANSNFNNNFLSRKTNPKGDLSSIIENSNFMNPNTMLNPNQSFIPPSFMMPSNGFMSDLNLNHLEYKNAFKNLIKEKIENEALSKSIYLKIDNINYTNIYVKCINHIYEKNSEIKLMMGDKLLFLFKNDKRLIKQLFANNFFIAVYDNQCILTCYSLFNTLVFIFIKKILSNVYIDEILFLTGYKEYILIMTSGNKMKIFNAFTKKVFLETKLEISNVINDELIGNYISNKIKSIKFLDLNKIIFAIDIKGENYFMYNLKLNELILIENKAEAENLIFLFSQNIKLLKSDYNLFLNDTILSTIRFYNEFEDDIEEVIKINFEIRAVEEKLIFHQNFDQKDEFLLMFKQLISLLIKHKLFYRLIDVLHFYTKYEENLSFIGIIYFEGFAKDCINVYKNLIPNELKKFINTQIFRDIN